MNVARKLFQQRPENVFEHPTDLPTNINEIPVGPLEDWWAFAPAMKSDHSCIIGPFTPEVVRLHDDCRPCIRTSDGTEFWYSESDSDSWRPNVPCWYQSGSTLRFVRTPEWHAKQAKND